MTTTDHRDVSGEQTVELSRPAGLPPRPPAGYPAAAWGAAPGYGPQLPWGKGFPPPAPFAPRPPRQGLSRNAWIAVAAAVVLIVAMVVVIVVGAGSGAGGGSPQAAPSTAPSTTNPGDPAMVLGSADLPMMLLNTAEIAQLVGQPASAALAKPGRVRTLPCGDKLLSGQECLPLAYTAEQAAHQGSEFTAMRGQFTAVRVPNDDPHSWAFDQGVFAYPSADAAEQALRANTARWKACEGKSWGAREDSGAGPRDVYWTGGQVENSDDLVIAPITQENGDGWGCWRGMTAVSNVVADFTVCGKDLPSSAISQAAAASTGKIRPI